GSTSSRPPPAVNSPPEPPMHMSRLASLARFAAIVMSVAGVACTDQGVDPLAPSPSRSANAQGFEGMGAFQRYVAIGTSISGGVTSDGWKAPGEQLSFPPQLARLANRPMALPLISGTGCAAPLAAPLASGVRTSGES